MVFYIYNYYMVC